MNETLTTLIIFFAVAIIIALSYSAFWMAVKTIRKVWKDKDIAKWKVSIALFIAISIVIISAIMLVKKLIIYQI